MQPAGYTTLNYYIEILIIYVFVCKRSLGWITYNNTFILHNQNAKSIPNCNVSFTNVELHQACGHFTLLINTCPKYVVCRR